MALYMSALGLGIVGGGGIVNRDEVARHDPAPADHRPLHCLPLSIPYMDLGLAVLGLEALQHVRHQLAGKAARALVVQGVKGLPQRLLPVPLPVGMGMGGGRDGEGECEMDGDLEAFAPFLLPVSLSRTAGAPSP